jgi:hypothetical protein
MRSKVYLGRIFYYMRSTTKNDLPEFDAIQAAKDWLRIENPTPEQISLIDSLAILLDGVFSEGLHIGLLLKTSTICPN